jgi:hypothetical protein
MKRLAGVVLGIALTGAGPAKAQEVTRDSLVAAAEQVAAHQAELARIWPGFWPEGQPFILHNPGAGAVLGGSLAPDAPEFRPGPLRGARAGFELDYPSGAPNTVVLRVDEHTADLSTLFHEQFHDFQNDAFRWSGGGQAEFVDLGLIPDRADFAARAELERRVLADALLTPDPAARRRLAAAFLSLRQARLGSLPAAVGDTEAAREWTEGTAEYVGRRGAAILAGRPSLLRDAIVDGLRKDLILAPGGFTTNWFRWRAYETGAARAWLLEDLGADWRPRIEAGARLDVVLDEALAGDARPLADAVLRERGFDAVVGDISARLAAAPPAPASRDEFLALAPRRLVVEVDVGPADVGQIEMSFQSPGMAPLPDGLLALPDAAYFVTRLGMFELSVVERPVLTDIGGARPRHVILLQSFEGLDTLAALPPGVHEVGAIEVEGEGIQLTTGPATIEVADDEILVRVQPR